MHPSKSLFLLTALHVVFADNFTNFSCFLSKRKGCQKLGAPEHNAFPFRIYYSPTEFTPPMFALSTRNNYRRLKVVRRKGKESYILYRGTSHHFYTSNILQTDKTPTSKRAPHKRKQNLRCMVMTRYFLCKDKLKIGPVDMFTHHSPGLVNHPS